MSLRARRSIRLPGFDYGSSGAYFVIVCTAKRRHTFGEVAEDRMRLSRIGKIADTSLREIPLHFASVEVTSHVVMPNHVHAILVLEGDLRRGVPWNAPTILPSSLAAWPPQAGADRSISPRAGTLGVIIPAYKGAVTNAARKVGFSGSIWQRGYYERVIRSDEERDRLVAYIGENPLRWALDEENPRRSETRGSR